MLASCYTLSQSELQALQVDGSAASDANPPLDESESLYRHRCPTVGRAWESWVDSMLAEVTTLRRIEGPINTGVLRSPPLKLAVTPSFISSIWEGQCSRRD